MQERVFIMSYIKFENVVKEYKMGEVTIKALDNTSFEIEKGELAMYNVKKVNEDLYWIGASDRRLALFENIYPIPRGVSYNSYVILDEKIAVMDTIDTRKTDEWKENLERVLDGRTPDYLVVSHLEPDHAGSIKEFADKYPEAKIVASTKAIAMLPQFFEIADLADRAVAV